MESAYIDKLVSLIDPASNVLLNATQAEAEAAVRSGDPAEVAKIQGQFAIVEKEGKKVRMARSIGRPMRYFLAKQAEGPLLIVAERMDEIQEELHRHGYGGQFHPSYTRMVPAHFVVEIELVGCPDPNPDYRRFFAPQQNQLPADVDAIGKAYVGALAAACDAWLDQVGKREPIGVLFSGGIDSGAVFLTLYHLLLQRGEAPTRLKAFTLSVAGGEDSDQAATFLAQLGLSMFWERVTAPSTSIDYRKAIHTIEDYKALDVQAAAMGLALCHGIRQRYPDWKLLVDGDGGDENLKDYPIEENPELTIRSVLNNRMLYQEGWGVDAIKHSLTYSGGQSRGHVRSYAPAKSLGFQGFSPFALPQVIEVAEGIPFIELTNWDHDKLYDLKGAVVASGIRQLTGMEMPIFPKRRFQRGATSPDCFGSLFPEDDEMYRATFAEMYGS